MLGGRESGVGRFSSPSNKFGLSPLNYIACGGTPPAGITELGRGSREAKGAEPVSAPHPKIKSPTVVHESPQYIVVEESPPPASQPNPVGPISPPQSARQEAYIQHVNGMSYLIRPSRGGSSGGGGGNIVPVGERLHLLQRAPDPRFVLRRGPSGPSVAGGAAGGGGGGSSPPRRGGGPSF